MGFRITKFSEKKAKRAVLNSSKIECGDCKPMGKIILNGLKKAK